MLGVYIDSKARTGEQELFERSHSDNDLIEVFPEMDLGMTSEMVLKLKYKKSKLVQVIICDGDVEILNYRP